MADNRYRPRSPPGAPPGGRRYNDPRSSTGMFYSSSYDPSYPSHPRSAIEPPYTSRHPSIYDTRPIKTYPYKDDAYPGGTVSRTEYAVRPRGNSTIPSDNRRPLSMMVKNTSPTRRPVVNTSVRDDARIPPSGAYSARDESRYLVPATSHGREHHRRQFSATQADQDRLHVDSRASGRPRPDYHQPGGFNQKSYLDKRASVRDDDYSYTGPREQFARDMQARPAPAREPYVRRERPVSVMEIPDSKPAVVRRDPRDMGPPPPRNFDKIDRPDDRRLSRPIYEKDERPLDLPQRRQSVRTPIVHQLRDEGYSSSRDDVDIRPKVRRERIEEDEPPPKPRPRELDGGYPREREYPRDPERERDREPREVREVREVRDRERDRDYERDRDRDRIRHEKVKHPDDRREVRSRESSPERSGVTKGIAAGLGGVAVAGLAGAALKGPSKADDGSESDAHKERRRRKHKHRDRADPDVEPRDTDDRRLVPAEDHLATDRGHGAARRDESASESYEDETHRRRHRRRKHRDREDPEALDPRATGETSRPDRDLTDRAELEPPRRRQDRAGSRTREPEAEAPERRPIPPGEDEDDRPRRVQLVEPEKKEEFRPRGILKAPRQVPFPEDPNPTREGVAPLKEAGKDTKIGIPQGARWTKISRVLVNPEALEKAHERFEERDEYVIVLRVVSKEEIQKFAEKTQEIRDAREKQWQEELENKKANDPEARTSYEDDGRRHHHHHRHDPEDDGSDLEDEEPQPLLDQKPAVPGVHPRDMIDTAAPATGVPVPDIKFEHHDPEPNNYSTNV